MKKNNESMVIVGIGASAGGLEALQTFVKHLPDNTNMAYIVAQHLSPTYKSLMVDLILKDTDHQVFEASNGLAIKADCIYICPPNKNIIIQNNLIVLREPTSGLYGPKPSVDILFESIAEEKGHKSIGIILSGTGSDGSRGVRAIKAEGGFVIIQDPTTAKYDGMPNSAINTGNIDLVLHAEQMGEELIDLLNYTGKSIIQDKTNQFTNLYRNILNKLKEAKGVDFNTYKPSTIQRRIERRMAALKITNLTDYHNFLVHNVEETSALFKDILIGVTSFFRDTESFEILETELRKYIEKKEEKVIRFWAPGCSTGEEAYSLAITLSLILGSDIGKYKIQIFATDIDEAALYFARKGMYPESALAKLDKKFRNKYFLTKTDHYEIIKPIREMVIFSRHDITKDPAFLKLDLVVCRNLLIYFSQDLQKKLFPMFHYALNDHGLLFLGKSESVGNFQTYFQTIDKKWKLFKANYLGRKEPPQNNQTFDKIESLNLTKVIEHSKKPTIQDRMSEYIVKNILPMCVIINNNMDIVFIKGKNPYLIRPDGEQTQNIFRNVIPTLSIELRAVIHNSIKEQTIAKSNFQKVILIDEVLRYVRIAVMPMNDDPESSLMLIYFQEESSENFKSFEISENKSDNQRTKELEYELARTKEHLQTVIEELETSNEEMQSLNEELQSSNEELQSTNEELETTNEELQSTNEELQTAYTEVRAMYDEKEEHAKQLAVITSDYEISNNRLESALSGINMGIYDYHIPIKKDDYWSDIWADLYGYKIGELPYDKSNMIDWIDERIHPDDLEMVRENRKMFNNGDIAESRLQVRIKHKKGYWIWIETFARAIQRDAKNNIIRIIGTSRDITERIENINKLSVLAQKLQKSYKIASMGSWEWNIEEDSLWWSSEVYEIFGLKETSITYELFLNMIHNDDKEYVEKSVTQALNKKSDYNITHRINHPTKGVLYVREIASIVFNKENIPVKMIGIIQNVTEDINEKKKLEESEKTLKLATASAGIGIWEIESINGIIYWDERSYEIFGLDKNIKITQDVFNKIIHPDDLDEVKQEMHDAITNKKIYNLVFRIIKSSGEIITIQGTAVPVLNNGKFEKLVGTNIDLTSRLTCKIKK
jgi:two-component system, chemotaxis family, CheB/CheR fusion protein